ncbi:nucleotide exchange factor GrpE [Ruania halotolerans]|uniref:nucleotide exchange factor GrpE n=1 Tax=Ruania halotolerans TaxID=2897773 RepID=UPI001E3A66F9|nr:nucleotide exchange factor GrpE [Ruania halotolerans]UFU06099.1 nucleotide exchange factor GrpE [Ruania halotolerans]
MSDAEQPVIRDKRRLDPTTGELRTAEEVAAADAAATAAAERAAEAGALPGEEPDGGASETPDLASAGAASGATDADDPVAAAKAEAADLQDQLARAKADLYNLDQRFNQFVKRSRVEVQAEKLRGVESVVEALVPVLDDVDAARAHGGLEGPLAAVVEKLESTLTTRFEVERFGAVGEEFDPNVHEALMHAASDEVESETVTQVLQPGYRVGERVVRPARVAVTGPQ